MIQIRILRWPEISENLIAHCAWIFSKGHLLFALIRHKWQNSLYKERAFDLKYHQWLERGAHVAWQRKYETWEIPRFVGRTISVAGGSGVIYTCTLYILEVHIGKKRIQHNSSVQKKNIHARSEGWKKTCSRYSLGWQYELHSIRYISNNIYIKMRALIWHRVYNHDFGL